jgi:hypothetical protein
MDRRKSAVVASVLCLSAGAFFWVRCGWDSRANAQVPLRKSQGKTESTAAATPSSEYSQRVVAYINETTSLTREEFGEYLIARFGTDRINTFVNLRIIQEVCKEKGVEVTSAEVESDLKDTITKMKTTAKDFESKILKPYHRTLYEWKEDVIRPRLMLSKLCKDRVRVEEEDISKAFDAHYGEKIECRLIMWPQKEKGIAMQIYPKIRDSEAEFDHVAKTQASPTLASMGGKIEPIGHYTSGNPALEKEAFALQPGELSKLIDTPDGVVVLKCVRHIPPQADIKLEGVRQKLTTEVFEKKLELEIPRYFEEIRKKANPQTFLKSITTEEELIRQAQHEIAEGATQPKK